MSLPESFVDLPLHMRPWVDRITVVKYRGLGHGANPLWMVKYGHKTELYSSWDEARGYAYHAACAQAGCCHICGHKDTRHIELSDACNCPESWCAECRKYCLIHLQEGATIG